MYRLVWSAGALALASTVSFGAAADGDTLAPLSVFQSTADGNSPAVVAADRDGYLYGFTQFGGGQGSCAFGGCGTVFKFKPGDSGGRIVLHRFGGAPFDGAGVTGLMRDADGALYGTTMQGGRADFGTVFKIAPDGSESLIHNFKQPVHSVSPDGIWPTGGVISGTDGNLYGTAWHGGINNGCGEGGCGTVFRVSPTGKFKTLYAFKGLGDSCAPYSGLSTDRMGNLYGTTVGCGHGNSGSVYKIAPDGTETVLYVFKEGQDGNDPISPPILDDEGNLYGGTIMGGGTGCGGPFPTGPGCGIIYKIAPDGTETVLRRLESRKEGGAVSAPLVRDAAGNLYGTTEMGGAVYACNYPSGCGTVFKLAPDGTTTVLHKFAGATWGDGAQPYFGLINGKGDLLYGATVSGPECCGMVFQIEK